MDPKNILTGDEARAKVLSGAKKAYELAALVYGPTSSNVALEKSYGQAIISHDGVTVLREVKLEDPAENIGAELLIQASKKTNDTVGDATTGTAILAYHIMEKASKRLAAGYNPMALRRGIDKAAVWVKEQVDQVSVPVDDDNKLRQVAVISCGNEAEGTLVAETLIEVGERGGVTIQEYPGVELEREIVEGFYFEKGWSDIRFVTHPETLEAKYEDIAVLVIEKRLHNVADIVPLVNGVLNGMLKANQRKLLVIGDVTGSALATLIDNKLKGVLETVVTSAPVYGDQKVGFLQDVAALTGATFISEGSPLEKITIEDLGSAQQVIVTQDATTILGGGGDKEQIQNRIDVLVEQLSKENSAFRKERMELRLAKLSGRIGLIKVGGATEVEMRERKFRIEDAVAATKAARESGIVPGGATTLLRISNNDVVEEFTTLTEDEKQGALALWEALQMPFRQLMTNAGWDAGGLVKQVLKAPQGHGYDVKNPTDEPIDLIAAGVVDPTKAIKQTVENAASVAGIAITTGAAITIIRKDQSNVSAA